MALVALSPIRKAHWVYSGAIPNCCNTGTKMKAINVHLAVADTMIKLITAVNKINMSRKRIVIKVGSNVLTRDDGKLDVTRMSALVDQIAWLRRNGYEIILVSSGSIASGRGELKVNHKLDSVEQRQLFSALGQVKLINLYYDLFREYDIHIGQILTMKESFSTRREYLNQRLVS